MMKRSPRSWDVYRAADVIGLAWEGHSQVQTAGQTYGRYLIYGLRCGQGRRVIWWKRMDAQRLYVQALAAYRQRAKALHPDHGGSTEAMRELNAAWAWLRRRLRQAIVWQQRAGIQEGLAS